MYRTRRNRAVPEISTASLPDIIFMLLFFFMVTSTIRKTTPKVAVQLPNAQTIEKLPPNATNLVVYVGQPAGSTTMQVQADNALINLPALNTFITNYRAKLPKYKQDEFSVTLKIHKNATMGLVKDVKDQLKKVGDLQIDYSANKN